MALLLVGLLLCGSASAQGDASSERLRAFVRSSSSAFQATTELRAAARTLLEVLKQAGWIDQIDDLQAAVGGLHLPAELSEAEQRRQDGLLLRACRAYEEAASGERLGCVQRLLDKAQEGIEQDTLTRADLELIQASWGYRRFDGCRELAWQTLADALRRDLFSRRDDHLVREAIAIIRRNCERP